MFDGHLRIIAFVWSGWSSQIALQPLLRRWVKPMQPAVIGPCKNHWIDDLTYAVYVVGLRPRCGICDTRRAVDAKAVLRAGTRIRNLQVKPSILEAHHRQRVAPGRRCDDLDRPYRQRAPKDESGCRPHHWFRHRTACDDADVVASSLIL